MNIEESEAMTTFRFMKQFAKTNHRKGKRGGDCNVTQCQKPGASSWNEPMKAYYCEKCITAIYESSCENGDSRFVFINPDRDIRSDYTFEYETEEMLEKIMEEQLADANRMLTGDVHSHKPFVRTDFKIGRNEKCPCDSNKKYKKCCGA